MPKKQDLYAQYDFDLAAAYVRDHPGPSSADDIARLICEIRQQTLIGFYPLLSYLVDQLGGRVRISKKALIESNKKLITDTDHLTGDVIVAVRPLPRPRAMG